MRPRSGTRRATAEERNNREDHEDQTEDPCDFHGDARHGPQTESTGNQRDDEEYNGVVEHDFEIAKAMPSIIPSVRGWLLTIIELDFPIFKAPHPAKYTSSNLTSANSLKNAGILPVRISPPNNAG
jgi:hypothetical protein